MPALMAGLTTGSVFAGYRVEEVAGRGGMGVVYRARQARPDRLVALKVVAPEFAADPGFRTRFEHESQIAASIEHPNVIPVYEAGEADGLLFIAMRYVEGSDFGQVVDDGIECAAAVQIVDQVARALDAAHARGLVHRDVKPKNILISLSGSRPHAYLTDFGLTKRAAVSGGMTRTGVWVGTLDYAAPEQIEGALGRRTRRCVRPRGGSLLLLDGRGPLSAGQRGREALREADRAPTLGGRTRHRCADRLRCRRSARHGEGARRAVSLRRRPRPGGAGRHRGSRGACHRAFGRGGASGTNPSSPRRRHPAGTAGNRRAGRLPAPSDAATTEDPALKILFAPGERWGWEWRDVGRLFRELSEPPPERPGAGAAHQMRAGWWKRWLWLGLVGLVLVIFAVGVVAVAAGARGSNSSGNVAGVVLGSSCSPASRGWSERRGRRPGWCGRPTAG